MRYQMGKDIVNLKQSVEIEVIKIVNLIKILEKRIEKIEKRIEENEKCIETLEAQI